MFRVIGMTKEELVALNPQSIDWQLSAEEIVYMAKTLGAYWKYNYGASRMGKVGLHAELKSLLHSDGFFVSAILLEPDNIRTIIANQLALRFNQLGIPKPDWVAGIPKGATKLCEDVAQIMSVKNAKMKKETERIELVSSIGPGESLLLVDDFCTRGTGFKEAVADIKSKQPQVKFLPLELVVLNRGGLKEIAIEGVGGFQVVAAVEHRVNDWKPEDCPLCKMGSKPIKSKAMDENWRLITTSQQ